ncbi:MAG: F0F1 ATP synthase subunit gamma [Alphaproteobacteria bacterium]
MPSLKDLRNRIASVKATQKITKAMQMVAAAKLRRAQPYAERMDKVLANLGQRVNAQEGASPLLVGTGSDKVHLLVVATAERGLCGGFNSNIARLARAHAKKLIDQGKDVKILCVGRKGRDALRRDLSSHIIDLIDMKAVKKLGFEDANKIGRRVLDMFENGEFDVCTLFFSKFQSILSQVPTALQLIPVDIPEASEEEASSGPQAAYEYEPDEEEILSDLLPRNISTQIYRGLLENAASEQGARMTSMDNATRNAGDMINDLTLLYNRSRQAQITKELIEIVSGAEALQ